MCNVGGGGGGSDGGGSGVMEAFPRMRGFCGDVRRIIYLLPASNSESSKLVWLSGKGAVLVGPTGLSAVILFHSRPRSASLTKKLWPINGSALPSTRGEPVWPSGKALGW